VEFDSKYEIKTNKNRERTKREGRGRINIATRETKMRLELYDSENLHALHLLFQMKLGLALCLVLAPINAFTFVSPRFATEKGLLRTSTPLSAKSDEVSLIIYPLIRITKD
jgi:hypothetical protein